MDVKVPDIKTNSWSLSEFSATRDRVLDISATAKTPARLFQQRGRNFLCAKTQENSYEKRTKWKTTNVFLHEMS